MHGQTPCPQCGRQHDETGCPVTQADVERWQWTDTIPTLPICPETTEDREHTKPIRGRRLR